MVVLPQPDGPRRKKSSPGLMVSETLSTAVVGPKRLVREEMEMGRGMGGMVRKRAPGIRHSGKANTESGM